ncbi:alanine racemase [Paenibacillus alkalitolerans]|uniref:alanine racemase n=1 Tax=Paenibacillus alkalitolerans TaxID=2799335 RepID=UPI002D7E9017|nr:alanine racemase [Paenibacillus alkalitolerans]
MTDRLETPCIVVDANQMRCNIRLMAERIDSCGVALRPHAKTHKIPEIAKLQIEAGAAGITVAKLSEADVMEAAGIRDIFIAYPVVDPVKLEKVARMSSRIRLIVGVDSLEGASRISAAALRGGVRIAVRLEVDTGLRRTGAPYEAAVELARRLNGMEGLDFRGIYTFRGNVLNGRPTLEVEEAGAEEGRLMVALAERIRAEGVEVKDVSIGSTPTAPYAAKVPGVTEVRPGTYVFNDRMQAALGTCGLAECAAKVRVTLVSRPYPDLIVVDGGSKTFATDVQPDTRPLQLQGFGYIEELPHAVFERMSEEHGMIRVRPEDVLEVGDVLHIVPNHVCSTVNLHNNLVLLDEGRERVVPVAARGMLT